MNISTVFESFNFDYDRYLEERLSLPYDINTILIQANDTVSANLINLKLKYLYENFLFLYKNSLIASNVIPVTSIAIAGVSAASTRFTWHKGLSTSQFIPISTNPTLSATGLDNTSSVFIIKNKDTGVNYALLSQKTSIYFYKFNLETTVWERVYRLNFIDPGPQATSTGYNVLFSNITAFAVKDNLLFVLDSARHQLIKYDATGFFRNNNILKERLIYVDSLGNLGGKTSRVEFDTPVGVTIYEKQIYVLDAGNSCVKVFDLDLNWLFTYRLTQDLLNETSVDIASDTEGNIFILTTKKLFKYNNNFTVKEYFDLEKFYGESFKKIIMSKVDDKVFYLLSDKNVYKKYTHKINVTIGKYLLYLYNYDLPNESLTSLAIADDKKDDIVLLFSKNTVTGKAGLFRDNINLYDILAVRDFDIYTFDQIKVNGNEYLQNWVINKALAKIIVNHMRYRDQLIGKFIARQDVRGNVVFENTRYLLSNEINALLFGQDLTAFLGSNEIVSSGSINRCLKFIHDAQISILNALQSEIINTPVLDLPINLN